MSDMRSTFRAYDNDGNIVFRATAAGKTFDIHDAVLQAFINRSISLGATKFEVIGK